MAGGPLHDAFCIFTCESTSIAANMNLENNSKLAILLAAASVSNVDAESNLPITQSDITNERFKYSSTHLL